MKSDISIVKQQLMRGFRLNGWQVKPLAGKIYMEEREIHLEPKIMDVLVCLACHQGEVVTREMLLEQVWGKVIVSDDAITRCISELRNILGDKERERAYIRTIPRRGYSLLVPVAPEVSEEDIKEELEHEQEGQTRGSLLSYVAVFALAVVLVLGFQSLVDIEFRIEHEDRARETPKLAPDAKENKGIGAIAVLPFVSLGNEIENAYFAEAISEDIRNVLMTNGDVRIAASTSSNVFRDKPMDVREIGEQLNVDALLEGTVRIHDKRLRITTQLTDTRNGYSLWAATFERDLADKIALQTEVAANIAEQLTPSLQTANLDFRGTTGNRLAQDYYFLGQHHWSLRTPESIDLAVNYFRQALALDKNYALAWAGLSTALIFQTVYDSKPVQEIDLLVTQSIERALELEPELAEVQAAYGMYLMNRGEKQKAIAAFEKAIALNPQHSMAHMWLGNILVDDRMEVAAAFEQYSEALKYDPLHPQVRYNHASVLTGMGRYDEAINDLEHYLKTDPRNLFLSALMDALLNIGRYDEVLNLAVGFNTSDEYKNRTMLTVVEALIELDRLEDAEKLINISRETVKPYEHGSMTARLALARQDIDEIKRAATFFEKNQEKFKHPNQQMCVGMMDIYLRGVAEYINKEYQNAASLFAEFKDISSQVGCRKTEIKLELMVLLYRAAALRHLNAEPAAIQGIIAEVDERLQELRNKGWDTPLMARVEVARHALAGDEAQVAGVIKRMENRGWKPYGMINSTPILKEIVYSLENFKDTFHQLSQEYASMQQSCNQIVLAKIGL